MAFVKRNPNPCLMQRSFAKAFGKPETLANSLSPKSLNATKSPKPHPCLYSGDHGTLASKYGYKSDDCSYSMLSLLISPVRVFLTLLIHTPYVLNPNPKVQIKNRASQSEPLGGSALVLKLGNVRDSNIP